MSATKESTTLELAVSVEGKITKSNFADFKAAAEERINSLNFSPETDEDFGQAEKDVKGLMAFEKSLGDAEDAVLKQMDEVYSLISGINELKEVSRENRLKLKKDIDSQKKIVRMKIKRDALSLVSISHPKAESRIEEAMKGKKTLESLKSAANGEAETIESEIDTARKVITTYRERHGESILYDEPALLILLQEPLEVELERRLERQRMEAEKAKLKAEAEAARKATAEAEAKHQQISTTAGQSQQSVATVETSGGGASLPSSDDALPLKTTDDASAEEEMDAFKAVLRSAFAPVKEARSALKHPQNIAAGEEFARLMTQAIQPLNKVSK